MSTQTRGRTLAALGALLGCVASCKLGAAPPGRCGDDSECRPGRVCGVDGGCLENRCGAADTLACRAGAYMGTRRCGDAGTFETLCSPNLCPCPIGLGVCQGAKRPCDEANCGPGTYAAHASDAGKLFQQFETACDGEDNDCDGLVDISSERWLREGREVALVTENGGAGELRLIAVHPEGIEARWFKWDFTEVTTTQPVGITPDPPVARTGISAGATAAGTYVGWRTDAGVRAALVKANTAELRAHINGPVSFGPTVFTPAGPGANAAMSWGSGAIVPFVALTSADTVVRAFDCAAPTVTAGCFPAPNYLEPLSQDPQGLTAGLIVDDGGTVFVGHLLWLLALPPTDGGACQSPPAPFPACIAGAAGEFTSAYKFGSTRVIWAATARGKLRYLLGNQESNTSRHSFTDQFIPDASTTAQPNLNVLFEEGVLGLSAARDGGDGRAWFFGRTDAGALYAVPESSTRATLLLSDAGVSKPAVAWSSNHPALLAVAYAVQPSDGGTSQIVGRLFCAPD